MFQYFCSLRVTYLYCTLLSLATFAVSCDDSPPPISETSALMDQNQDDQGLSFPLPLEHIKLNHLQALGTHNSYHLRPAVNILPWDYEHLSLDQQLEQQGVRQFELDLYEREEGGFDVLHIPRLDPETNCSPLKMCFDLLKGWSDTHQAHHPILVLLEVKNTLGTPQEVVTQLETIVNQTWRQEQLITPGLIMREKPTLRDALNQLGWPSLNELRGRFLIILHSGGELRDALLEGGLVNRSMFPDAYGDLNVHFAAYHSINDPIASETLITAAVTAGHLVRTRADVNSEQTLTLDMTRGERALALGAHWISTDYPTPGDTDQYGFVIPGGSPSRCNPVTAPLDCHAEAIEALGSH